MKNPCIGCAACCSYFRVSFYQGEIVSLGGKVPDEYVDSVSPTLVAMKGTLSKPSHCIKMSGKVGENGSCSIYECRSSTCREFKASFENGILPYNEHCDKARNYFGLKPLTPEDWK